MIVSRLFFNGSTAAVRGGNISYISYVNPDPQIIKLHEDSTSAGDFCFTPGPRYSFVGDSSDGKQESSLVFKRRAKNESRKSIFPVAKMLTNK